MATGPKPYKTQPRTARAKLAEISLDRDLYSEVCAEQGFIPLCDEPRATADILRSLNVARAFAPGGILCA